MAAVQSPIISSGNNWTINGQPWSRSALLSHLYGGSHGHARGSLDHLSLSQLQAMHTNDHEGYAASPSVVSRRQPVRMVYASSGCPSGGCPSR